MVANPQHVYAPGPKPQPIDPVAARKATALFASTIASQLYPYQLRYIQDRNLRKYALWSRQVGKSRTAALDSSLTPWEKAGIDEVMVSASDTRARELLRKARWWGDLFDAAMRQVCGQSVYLREPSQSEIVWFNESRTLSHPSNPRTAAGYTGNVTLDEASKLLDDEEMWTALQPVTSSGAYIFRMTGTPWGARGVFWRVCTAQIPGFSGHLVTIHDAVRQGCPRDIARIRSECDALMFAQEYECKFVARLAQAFGPDLLRACAQLDLPTPPPVGARDAAGQPARYALGIDVGRTNDRTDVIWACEYPEGYFQVPRVASLRNAAFQDQYQFIEPIVANPGVETVKIDQNGIGRQLAEDLHRAHPGKVQGVTITAPRKAAMVSLALARMEAGRVKLDSDPELLGDLGAIERKVLPSGAITYDAPRTKAGEDGGGGGHADAAWGFMLALSALAENRDMNCDFGFDKEAGQDGQSLAVRDALARLTLPLGGLPTGEQVVGDEYGWSAEDLAAMSDEEKLVYGIREE